MKIWFWGDPEGAPLVGCGLGQRPHTACPPPCTALHPTPVSSHPPAMHAVDAEIVRRFTPDCEALLRGEYDSWAARPLEALAGIIIGDQLSRNAFRGTPRMYAADSKVLAWAKQLVVSRGGKKRRFGAKRRGFRGCREVEHDRQHQATPAAPAHDCCRRAARTGSSSPCSASLSTCHSCTQRCWQTRM